MSKLKILMAIAFTSVLVLILSNALNLADFSFATSFWIINLAGLLAALISSNKIARLFFFMLIGLNLIGVSHIAYVSISNADAPVGGLAIVALIFNINVWVFAVGASSALNWQASAKYSKTDKRSNWTKIDQGEDPTI
ncbi:MAG: hypothetical protein RLZZ330_850 [Actinomycetota bacterium]|jgi:hypothetical protein